MGDVVPIKRGMPAEVLETLLKEVEGIESVVIAVAWKDTEEAPGYTTAIWSEQKLSDVCFSTRCLEASVRSISS